MECPGEILKKKSGKNGKKCQNNILEESLETFPEKCGGFLENSMEEFLDKCLKKKK